MTKEQRDKMDAELKHRLKIEAAQALRERIKGVYDSALRRPLPSDEFAGAAMTWLSATAASGDSYYEDMKVLVMPPWCVWKDHDVYQHFASKKTEICAAMNKLLHGSCLRATVLGTCIVIGDEFQMRAAQRENRPPSFAEIVGRVLADDVREKAKERYSRK